MSVESQTGLPRLFWEAFGRSRNAMVLLDDHRDHVEVNDAYADLLGRRRSELIGRPVYEFIVGGPVLSTSQWRELLKRDEFSGVADLISADARRIRLEFAACPEIVTGKQLVLVVGLKANRGTGGRHEPPRARRETIPLSDRELEVIRLIGLGLSGPEIAGELQIAHNTVRTHVRNAMSKLDARSRAHLVAISLAEARYWQES